MNIFMVQQCGISTIAAILLRTVTVSYTHLDVYKRQALDSVCTQEGDFSIEILVIDDNSTDATKNIVLDMACRISTRENNLNNGVSVRLLTSGRSMGVAEARNLGIDVYKRQE